MIRNRSSWPGLLPMSCCVAALFSSAAYGQDSLESVYAPPEIPTEGTGVNEGAVHFQLGVSYYTDYIFRGVDMSRFLEGATSDNDSLNLQIDAKLSFDLGKLPHPYVSAFVNVSDDDEISNFQEVRPSVGFDWFIKPLVISAGYTSYIYPDRDEYETSEVFFGVALDDRILVGGRTIPVPYALAAYDFDLYDGVYIEAGIRYRMPFEDIGLVLTATGSVGYVSSYNQGLSFTVGGDAMATVPGIFTRPESEGGTPIVDETDSINGFQHWQVGLTAEYSLNKLFNVSTRYGEWSLRGAIYYTEDMEDDLAGTSQIWGGGGIVLRF